MHYEDQRQQRAGFFREHQRGARGGRGGVAIGQEQREAQHGEQHGRHVQLRQHGLRVKQRVEQQERGGQNGWQRDRAIIQGPERK